MKRVILIILISGLTNIYAQAIQEKFYGTWTCSYKSNHGDILNNVAWEFENNGKGYFTNYSDSSNKNGITCTTTIPISWTIIKQNQIFIVNGAAECKCVSAYGQSKNVLERISQSIIKAQSKENYRYDFSFESEDVLIMGGFRMKKS